MKIKLSGKNLGDIMPLLDAAGFKLTRGKPELIVAHGGDGTLLMAERDFPSIPKLPLRDSGTAPLCSRHSYDKQLKMFCDGKTTRTELTKLSGEFGKYRITGMNDIFIHNLERVSALRYQVWIDDELYANEIVGDGVGLAARHPRRARRGCARRGRRHAGIPRISRRLRFHRAFRAFRSRVPHRGSSPLRVAADLQRAPLHGETRPAHVPRRALIRAGPHD